MPQASKPPTFGGADAQLRFTPVPVTTNPMTPERHLSQNTLTNGNLKTLQEKAKQMSAEFEEMRKSRLAMEQRAERLQQLLDHERREREAWLAAFLGALQNTLSDLNSCVDRSMEESGKLMRGRLEEADGRMQRLMHRVDEIFTPTCSTKDHATVPSSPGLSSRASTDLSSSAQARIIPTPPATGNLATMPDQMAQRLQTPPATGNLATLAGQRADGTEELMQCWTELLSENLTLQQRHKALIEERQRAGKSSGSSRSTSRGRQSPETIGGNHKTWLTRSAGGSPRVNVQGTNPRHSTSIVGAPMPVVREIS